MVLEKWVELDRIMYMKFIEEILKREKRMELPFSIQEYWVNGKMINLLEYYKITQATTEYWIRLSIKTFLVVFSISIYNPLSF